MSIIFSVKYEVKIPITMYTDDTSGTALMDSIEPIQAILNLITPWCRLNELTIDIDNTKSMK